ncbi:tRNA pseudouridine synthase D (TruD) domain containing protein, putative [Babesia bigemina]|uniref:tRNA pseudouridine synthase D (TruD) domain containing protein, putative n=1 Tax=Babesia bigemina TaxID=5866 RepID=A0A061D6G1_BABBI|nr:tRNA pseudouridine synthase D (TruD) domain containing protein, putative [Babesia bigemina]CDR96143.1 tRNA pseudouridine synthase D (TruD) domain containing protein, putative [Babesia bigemina]|eukprot:XP_012768329.1 tRNA pseudouridine synthase D (TruD) domain containing protein, putative [Babesia bigemina]
MDNMGDLDGASLPLLGKSRLLGMGTTMVELMMPNVYTERIEGFIKYIPEDFVVNEIDLNGRIVVARRTAHTEVAKMALEHERNRTSGEMFLKLRRAGNVMGTVKYPSNIFTEDDGRCIDALLDELVLRMSDDQSTSISIKNPPFCLLALQENENAKELRTLAHTFIRENLPFLDSEARPLNKAGNEKNLISVGNSLSDESADGSRLVIKVFPRPDCIRFIQRARVEAADTAQEVLKDMPTSGMPTLKGVVKHLDLTEYDKIPEDYKERQKIKQYLHFNIQKRDRSTHEITHMLCRTMRRSSYDIFTAGNKDRRAITTQRFCMRRAKIEDFVAAMAHPKWLDTVVVADFRYSDERLRLGDLRGNSFWVTIRGVSDVQQALLNLESLRFNGFLNYFGLQRFGSMTVGTHMVGAAMLRRDYEDVARLIINNEPAMERYLSRRAERTAAGEGAHTEEESSENPVAEPGSEERNNDSESLQMSSTHGKHAGKRRRSRNFKTTAADGEHGGNKHAMRYSADRVDGVQAEGVECNEEFEADRLVSDEMPVQSSEMGNTHEADALMKPTSHHSFIERELMNGMERNRPIEDVLKRIPANVLSIYVHAAQSLVFNHVLTERLKKYGTKPVPGDFVIKSSQLPLTTSVEGESSETATEKSDSPGASFGDVQLQTYVVCQNDTDKWSLYDVVLPLPGDNVDYPEFLRPVYQRVVSEQFGISLDMFATVIGNLPPQFKGRERCLVGVGGGYRHIVARAHGLQYHVVPEQSPNGGALKQNLSPYVCLRNQLKQSVAAQHAMQNHDINFNGDSHADYTNQKLATRSTLVVSCALPKSCYLTCALREVLSDESLERQYIG